MKKLVFFSLVSLFATAFGANAQSESYKPFQFNFTGGFAIPGGTGAKGGIALHIEPQYNITDNFSAGLRLGTALIAKTALDNNGQEIGDASVAGVATYLATGTYYFQKTPGSSFRPFAGVGLGYGSAAGASVSSTVSGNYADDFATKGGFSGLMRAGFDVSHFRLNIEYALNPKTGRIANNYFGINLGFYLGGGATK